MKTAYVETVIKGPGETQEVLVALLAELGYEAFEERENDWVAFIQEPLFDEEAVGKLVESFVDIHIAHQVIPPKNWNEEWEKEYPSIFIDDFVQILPTFRQAEQNFQYSLFIDPKMAFGTGHHATTRLMILQMKSMEIAGKNVLDMGCGTGILGILALKMGANSLVAIDIDPWSVENTNENLRINKIDRAEVLLGGKDVIPNTDYDLILANINRNVLLDDIEAYSQHLVKNGKLVLSGIYEADEKMILETSSRQGLVVEGKKTEMSWLSLVLVKSDRKLLHD